MQRSRASRKTSPSESSGSPASASGSTEDFPAERLVCGDTLDGFLVVADMGSGLSGDVYLVRARDDPSEFLVLKHHRIWKEGVSAETFAREAGILEAQPIRGNMPVCIARGARDGRQYVVMSLEGANPEHGELSPEGWFSWILELVDAFDRLNNVSHIFHRDVKPANIRTTDGHPKIIDFGLARKDDGSPFPLERVGSRDFIAPEIFRYEPYTVRAEIYSVAKTIEAIVPDDVKHALSTALFNATKNDRIVRTPSWSVFRREAKAGIAAYRRNAPARQRRRIALAAGIWKTRIVARHVFLAFACLSAIAGTVYAALHLHLRSKHLAFAQMESDYRRAESLYKAKKYSQALKLLVPIAECECRRTPEACLLLAECHKRGLGVHASDEKFREYMLKYDEARKHVLVDGHERLSRPRHPTGAMRSE